MTGVSSAGRRGFLMHAGVGGTVLLAGCTGRIGTDGQEDVDDPDEVAGTNDESGVEGEEVGVVVRIPREAFQDLEAEIRRQVEEGEIEQAEAQAAFVEARDELVQERMDAMLTRIETDTQIGIDQRFDEVGGARVVGEPGELIAALGFDEVAALIPAEQFDQPPT